MADALNELFVAEENWRKLPADIVETIQRITGADGKKQIKKGHLDAEYPNRNQPLVYVVGYMEQVGTPVYGQHGQQVATSIRAIFSFRETGNATSLALIRKASIDLCGEH